LTDGELREEPQYAAVIIGAGVCGIYQLYRLAQLGVSVAVLEAGADLGGTWFYNRYPGARLHSESYSYGYSFSKELLQEWDWKERFSGQPENLRYLNYVADKFDLRKHMQFNCVVNSAKFDEGAALWRLHLNDGPISHAASSSRRSGWRRRRRYLVTRAWTAFAVSHSTPSTGHSGRST
jgi:cation diffusion facilitator CzcD-associated flavoprotein CzcO